MLGTQVFHDFLKQFCFFQRSNLSIFKCPPPIFIISKRFLYLLEVKKSDPMNFALNTRTTSAFFHMKLRQISNLICELCTQYCNLPIYNELDDSY